MTCVPHVAQGREGTHSHTPLILNTVISLVRHSAEEGIERRNVRYTPPQCGSRGYPREAKSAERSRELPYRCLGSARNANPSDPRAVSPRSDVLGRSGIYWRVFRRRRREEGPGGRRPWPGARCLLWWGARGPVSDPEGAGEARGLGIVSRTFSRILPPS